MTGDERGGGGDEEMEMEEMLEWRVLDRGMIGRRWSEDRSTGPRACRRGLAVGRSGMSSSSSSTLESSVTIGNIRSRSGEPFM